MTLGVKAHKTAPHLINNALQKLERLQREERRVSALCNVFTVEWKEKIINAIKYSKINQHQQTLIKTSTLRMFYYF